MTNDAERNTRAAADKDRTLRLASLTNFLDRHERIFNVLNTTITAIFTVVLATSTVFLWKETKDLRDFAQDQSTDMKSSIREAARSADAMKEVAKAVGESAKAANDSTALFKEANIRQMRAYLTIGLAGVVKQDNKINYRFEVRVNVQNVGNTPAYKTVTEAHSAIMDFPLAKDFSFPVINANNPNAGIIQPHQSYIVRGIADQIYSDEDVNEAESGTKKQLYVYGAISYEDAFGISRHINFCQVIHYLKDGSFMSQNYAKYNDAD